MIVATTKILRMMCLFILFSSIAMVNAQTVLNTKLVGRWGEGISKCVETNATTAYYGNGAYIDVVDVSNPGSPQKIGEMITPGFVTGLDLAGNYLYVADDKGGLLIVNVANPSQIYIMGTLALTTRANVVKVSGNRAYIGADRAFVVADISNPTNPTIIASVTDNDLTADDILLHNQYVLVACSGYGVIMYDVSNPAQPVRAASFDQDSHSHGLAIRGNRMYVCEDGYGVRILDITNILQPVEVGAYKVHKTVEKIQLVGNNAYVCDGINGFYVLDIANIDAPVLYSRIRLDAHAYDVSVVDTIAVIANGLGGLEMVSVANPSQMRQLSRMYTAGESRRVDIRGGKAYIAGKGDGVAIIDLAEAGSPVRIGTVPVQGQAFDVEVAGRHAYIADIEKGLRIADISDPANPVIVSDLDSCDLAYEITLHGRYAYMACATKGLRIVDISDPAKPFIAATIDTIGYVSEVATDGKNAFIVERYKAVRIIDVSHLPAWQYVETYPVAGVREAIALKDSFLCTVNPNTGLEVWNVADVHAPVVRSTNYQIRYANQINIEYPLVYIVDYYQGLSIYSLNDPGAPTLTGNYPPSGNMYSSAVKDDTVYVADNWIGLYILQYTHPTGIDGVVSPGGIVVDIYPQPVSSVATVRYSLDTPGYTTIAVYDERGSLVQLLDAGWLAAGTHTAAWNPSANRAAAGMYFVRVNSGVQASTQPCIVTD